MVSSGLSGTFVAPLLAPTCRCGTGRCLQGNKKPRLSGVLLRADDGVRTRDPQLGKLMLYHLSYVRAGSIVASPHGPRSAAQRVGTRARASRRGLVRPQREGGTLASPSGMREQPELSGRDDLPAARGRARRPGTG